MASSRSAKPLIYYDDLNPHSRCVLMLLKLLDVDIDLRFVNMLKGEHFKERFLKFNPAHLLPCLVHENVIITDSNAMLIYVCDNFPGDYSKQLLPVKCYKKRLCILDRLFFESSVLHRRHGELMTDLVRKTYCNTEMNFHKKRIEDVYDSLNGFLKENSFMAGNSLTIADLAIVASVGALDMMFPLGQDRHRWGELFDWHKRMKSLPIHKINFNGTEKQREVVEMFGQFEFPSTIRRRGRASARRSHIPRPRPGDGDRCHDIDDANVRDNKNSNISKVVMTISTTRLSPRSKKCAAVTFDRQYGGTCTDSERDLTHQMDLEDFWKTASRADRDIIILFDQSKSDFESPSVSAQSSTRTLTSDN